MPNGGKSFFRIYHKRIDLFFTTKEKDVAFGLSIGHKIADQHNGNLTASSQNGRTVFSLVLPTNSYILNCV
jgi:nitrogen-specific signal transduction histidine kinase